MRVLLRIGGIINKGDEAMLRTTVHELGKRLPGAQFFLLPDSLHPGTEALAKHCGVTVYDYTQQVSSRAKRASAFLLWLLRHPLHAAGQLRNAPPFSVKHLLLAVNSLQAFDAICDISGFAYTSNWGSGWAIKTRAILLRARELGMPYVFMPQAWGPFLSARNVFGDLSEWATLLYARDSHSAQSLAELGRRPAAEIRVCPDVAFRFHGDTRDEGSRTLERYGVSIGAKPVAGITPNTRIYDRAPGTGAENTYIRALVFAATTLVQKGYSVVLLPHEIQETDCGSTDDRLLCSLIAALAHHPDIVAVTDRLNSPQLKGIVANLALLVGSRYHSLVAALSTGVPVLAFAWSHKYPELLRLFEQDAFIVEMSSYSDDKMAALLQNIHEQGTQIRQTLATRLPEVQAQVDTLYDTVAKVYAR